MKTFNPKNLEELDAMYRAVTNGEMVLHHIPGRVMNPAAPACFRRANGYAYLMCKSRDALEAEVQKAGVRKVRIDRKRRDGVGIYFVTYLCGSPLDKIVKKTSVRNTVPRVYTRRRAAI